MAFWHAPATPRFTKYSGAYVFPRDFKHFSSGCSGCKRDPPPWSTQAERRLRDMQPGSGACQCNRLPVVCICHAWVSRGPTKLHFCLSEGVNSRWRFQSWLFFRMLCQPCGLGVSPQRVTSACTTSRISNLVELIFDVRLAVACISSAMPF